MEARNYKPYILIIILMIATSLVLAFTVDVTISGEAGVKFVEGLRGGEMMYLPDRIGDWEGEQILYCQNPECQKGWSIEELQDYTICPDCGGRLDPMTQAEKDALPIDTEMVKKRFISTTDDGEDLTLFVNIVLSGRARNSIHRPQRCLVAAGSTIKDTEKIEVPINDSDPLDVMLIDNVIHVRDNSGGEQGLQRYFAYWFIGRGRVTESHYERMAYMAIDRVFFNVAHRWAYISVSGGPPEGMENEEFIDLIKDFISELHPQIILDESA
jgi:hypothetical protein